MTNKDNKPRVLDLESLRISQELTEFSGVVDTAEIPVRRPTRDEWVRVRPGSEWRLETNVLELKDERQVYLVAPDLWEALEDELISKVLTLAVSREGQLFLWPVRLPGPDGHLDDWNRAALDAQARAALHWVRLVPNRSRGTYDVREAKADWAEPKWPELGFQQIVELAFADRYIADLDHPVVLRLWGDE